MSDPPLIRVDSRAHQAWQGDRRLRLTRLEFRLLRFLAASAGTVMEREDIIREVWETDWLSSDKTLDMHISWLRRKLGDDATRPRYITTVRGVGFRMERDAVDPRSDLAEFAPPAAVGDILAVVRETLSGLARSVAQAEKRLAELERAQGEQEVTPGG